MSKTQGSGSTGAQTPRRLVGPERASIRMLNSPSGPNDRSSAEACEAGSLPGAASGLKFGMLTSVSQRLNEMSSTGARPPTPIGSNEDAGAVMAHLAPTRRAHSRFASPSKADSMLNRLTSKSGSFAVPSYTSQFNKAGSPHDQPYSGMPEDLDSPGPSLAPLQLHPSGSGSASPTQATHSVSFTDDPHGHSAPSQQGSERPAFLQPSLPSPNQRSAPLPTLPRLQNQDISTGGTPALPSSLSGTANMADSPRSRRRPSNLGPIAVDRSSSMSHSGPLHLHHSTPSPSTSQPQVASTELNPPYVPSRKSATSILDDTDFNVCASPSPGGSFTHNSRRSSMAGRPIPTILDTAAGLRNNQHGEGARQTELDGRHPSFFASGLHDRGDTGEESVDALSSWMQNR